MLSRQKLESCLKPCCPWCLSLVHQQFLYNCFHFQTISLNCQFAFVFTAVASVQATIIISWTKTCLLLRLLFLLVHSLHGRINNWSLYTHVNICIYVCKYGYIQIDTYILTPNNFLLHLKSEVLFLAVKVPHELTCLHFQIRLYRASSVLVFWSLKLQNAAFSASDALYLLFSVLAQRT